MKYKNWTIVDIASTANIANVFCKQGTNTAMFHVPHAELLEELEKNGSVRKVHTAAHRGYISRKSKGIVKMYDGRYGKGVMLDEPRFDTTRYHARTYYVV